jgi:UDP-glucose 4-epimerase
MRILITGGAGFIGSHIVDALVARGDRVLVVDDLSTGSIENLSEGAELARVDIRSPELRDAVERFRPQAVSHLAAQTSVAVSMREPMLDATTNIIGGINLCQAAIAAGCEQFAYVTTGGALYGEPDYLPCDEDHPIRPVSPYGLSKWTLERYLTLLLPAGVPLKVLRLANIYGPRQDPNGEGGVVSIFGARMLRDEDVVIFGDGEQTRDFLYVEDVARAHELALAAPASLTVNVSSGQPLSVNALFRLMAESAGYERTAVHAAERPGDVKHNVLANARVRALLGWAPRVELREGLRRTLDWLGDGVRREACVTRAP